jgi:CRP-like cAMP-binding protein
MQRMHAVLDMLKSKLSAFVPLEKTDEDLLRQLLESDVVRRRRGDDLISQGDENVRGFIVLDGWAFRSKMLPDGRRQILSFIVPGDIVGLFAPVTPVATSSVTALTELTVARQAPQDLVDTITSSPRLAAAFAWAAAREKEVFAEHILTLGRRTARERTAHLYVELWARLHFRGMTNGHALRVPVTQEHIADNLGLSVVHVNRTLRQLEKEGLLTVRRHEVTIHEMPKLQDEAGFDGSFLLQQPAPVVIKKHVESATDRSAAGKSKDLDL